MPKKPEEVVKEWEAKATAALAGRKVVGVRYMTDAEARERGWIVRPLVLTLDDGTEIYPVADDEGNNGGVLWGEKGERDLSFPGMWVS